MNLMLSTNSSLSTMFCLNMMFLFQKEFMLFQLLINIANVHHSTKLKSGGGEGVVSRFTERKVISLRSNCCKSGINFEGEPTDGH